MYSPIRPSTSRFLRIRTHQYHLREWGQAQPGVPSLVMVHGWMDVAASFQFVVDALEATALAGRHIISPDWRGYGLTHHVNNANKSCMGEDTDNYWLPDYMADLDFLVDHVSQDAPIDLLGHSLGGNVVMSYAGVRAERIRRLVNLEGFGMPETKPAQAPTRYAQWLDQLKQFHKGEMAMRAYPAISGVASRLMKTNPRLSQAKADWLAQNWSAKNAAGEYQILGDPAHKIVNANLSRVEETLALYQRISMPLLAIEASDDSMTGWYKGRYTLADYHERLKQVPNARIERIEDAGHMLHHDQPEQLAALLAGFLA
ncbi:alpha/beta hydrolase [Variovorax sp. PCZ-1]|uniref:alpha/beta fold hydrolase n=1 Tax=Variovorax sp. PCZ-1 TaxID=2835533 RepID=UPI001BCFE998|nr:alpha/beta hydrolase [Variovorax sp. PCZ-1]MBS7806890.1 alpha/beta hydrolase [Variovorax sp. PCZ-1]